MLPLAPKSSSSSTTLFLSRHPDGDIKVCDSESSVLIMADQHPNPSTQTATPSAAADPNLPLLLRLPQELKKPIFQLLFANKDPHEVCSVGTISPRSGQVLRVCKLMHEEAGAALYGMTRFEYSGMALRHPEYLPALRYRSLIEHLTLEDPEWFSF